MIDGYTPANRKMISLTAAELYKGGWKYDRVNMFNLSEDQNYKDSASKICLFLSIFISVKNVRASNDLLCLGRNHSLLRVLYNFRYHQAATDPISEKMASIQNTC